MSLTLLALFFTPIALKMVLNPQGMHKILRDWETSRSLQFLSALIPLVMAALIFSTSAVSFQWKWDSLLSWLGVFIALKGISHLFPSLVEWQMRFVNEQRIPIFGFVALLVALGIIYVDTQVL